MFEKLRCCSCYAGLGHHLQKCRCQKFLVVHYPVHACVARLCVWLCQFVGIICSQKLALCDLTTRKSPVNILSAACLSSLTAKHG